MALLTDSVTPSLPNTAVDDRLVALSHRHSFEAEQFRRLRHAVEELSATRGLHVIAVTSAVASDGKTLTSVNLACVLAEGRGARVLLIDGDLRRPSVAATLGIVATHGGLLAATSGTGRRLDDYLYRVDGTTLDVLPCERSESATYELLTSPAFRALINNARAAYDFVVVDTPPIVPVPDSKLLSSVVDGYLLVVAANSTPRTLLGEALNLLDDKSVLGIVFNRDARPLFGYYGSYYRRYFKSYARSIDRADG